MKLLNHYIPKEYLALRINYCRMQLMKLPVVRVSEHIIDGVATERVFADGHRYNIDSVKGKKCLEIRHLSEQLTANLNLLETVWKNKFNDPLPKECIPHRVIRNLRVDYQHELTLNKEFFDSLESDSNSRYPKNGSFYFDGIYYRSAAERDIAIFYTELGIPFKYEPSIIIEGVNHPVHPDFVIYIEELDTCIFHEHLGIKDSSNYLRTSKIKYSNYVDAGLIPDVDILFTYDTDDLPFDIRSMPAKLNAAIYTLIISSRKSSAPLLS